MVNIFVSIERNIILIHVYIFLSDLQMIYKWRKISKNNSGKSISKIMKKSLHRFYCIFIVFNMYIMHFKFVYKNISLLKTKLFVKEQSSPN